VVRSLVTRIEETAERLELFVALQAEAPTLVELTAYATTLSMNYLTRGSFVPKPRTATRSGAAPAGGKT